MKWRMPAQAFIAGYWFSRLWHEGFNVWRVVGFLLAAALILDYAREELVGARK